MEMASRTSVIIVHKALHWALYHLWSRTNLNHTYSFTNILEVNLCAFAYRLFHEDFSSIDGAQQISVYKSSPLSTLPLVIPEYIWIVLLIYSHILLLDNM